MLGELAFPHHRDSSRNVRSSAPDHRAHHLAQGANLTNDQKRAHLIDQVCP
jgi:hypothetical protein